MRLQNCHVCCMTTSSVLAIGHELQHAIEVLRDPHVTDIQSAYLFFLHKGPTASGRFETEAAIAVGQHIGLKTCAHAKSR